KRVADASARSSEQVALGLAGRRRAARIHRAIRGAAAQPRPVDVALEADQNGADRVIEPSRAAEQKAAGVENAGSQQAQRPLAASQTIAAIEAQIGAGPVCVRAVIH